ncbi:membrane protein [Formosimonas limnophila]|uniref:Membrane protein n=1 Tax=Formosimonas limnophila TaxID=1384487 RepID=A0A8J3CNS9_9BURK|nr:neutral zinc metallopeptidase [Formosimonas limnophila]GHA77798.1 membrane protein [Formosimonas limnophila]
MRLDQFDESGDIEDRRGQSGGGGRISGGGRLGISSLILAAIAYFVFGVSPSTTLSGLDAVNSNSSAAAPSAPVGQYNKDQNAVFVSKILQSTKTVWTDEFAKAGGRYQPPALVLYENATRTACGVGQAAAGPFYCPGDQKIYLDMSFFAQMSRQMGAGGDFAYAYVIAHEVGHHVQNQMGIEEQVNAQRQRVSETQANALSVRLELQADCFAGVWANKTQEKYQFLEQGDIEEGLNAAHKIGDDYLQKQAQGYAVPDSFTHGSSAQRARWFTQGLKTGDWRTCDTFRARAL